MNITLFLLIQHQVCRFRRFSFTETNFRAYIWGNCSAMSHFYMAERGSWKDEAPFERWREFDEKSFPFSLLGIASLTDTERWLKCYPEKKDLANIMIHCKHRQLHKVSIVRWKGKASACGSRKWIDKFSKNTPSFVLLNSLLCQVD